MSQRAIGSEEPLRASAHMSSAADAREEVAGRRDSDNRRPRWQTDDEVTECPICNAQFTFFFRKHHCRKCGRVVCANCSPHRITIPRQYIVLPTNFGETDNLLFSLMSMDHPSSSEQRNLLSGNEVVRVCNPCVPDPWTPNTAGEWSGPTLVQETTEEWSGPTLVPEDVPPLPRDIPTQPRRHVGGNRGRAQSDQPASIMSRMALEHPHANPTAGFPWYDTLGIYNTNNARRPAPLPLRAGTTRNIPPRPSPDYDYSPRYRRPLLPSPANPITPTSPLRSNASTESPPLSGIPPRRQRRRQVREEDECPVCGTELPPGEDLRETHVESCITARFAPTITPLSSTAPPAAPTAAQSRNFLSPDFYPPSMVSRPRATSYRPRGMALFTATEKDCTTTNTSGEEEPQECIICFEEFQPGDEMGRMECLCKFHRICIRTWWDTKGTGACPTHMLHD